MTGSDMLSTLGLRLEDSDEASFPEQIKLDAINLALRAVANLLHNSYLTELQVVDANIGMASNALAFSELTYIPLRNGIVAVKDNPGNGGSAKWATMIAPEDQKKLENTYMAASDSNPISYVFSEKIYVDGLGPTSAIDVWYIREPFDIVSVAASPAIATQIVKDNECELNAALHEAIIYMAEAHLWEMDAKQDRANSARKTAMSQIDTLNARYPSEAPKGVA
tara:strand:+ start:4835 stop:5503 length:669 start_codon:yes stop_codon:yes gene_type:complete